MHRKTPKWSWALKDQRKLIPDYWCHLFPYFNSFQAKKGNSFLGNLQQSGFSEKCTEWSQSDREFYKVKETSHVCYMLILSPSPRFLFTSHLGTSALKYSKMTLNTTRSKITYIHTSVLEAQSAVHCALCAVFFKIVYFNFQFPDHFMTTVTNNPEITMSITRWTLSHSCITHVPECQMYFTP